MQKIVVAIVLGLMISVLGGCRQETLTADQIVTRVEETLRTTNDLHAVVDLSMQSPQESGSGAVEVWFRRAGTDAQDLLMSQVRVQVLEASEAKLTGVQLVSDGQQAWGYLPAQQKVYTGSLAELKAMHEEQEGAVPSDPLAAAEQLRALVERGLETFDVQLLGEEQVAGQPAYKVALTPKQDSPQQIQLLLQATLWIDQQRWLPLKLLVDAGSMGRVEITARSIETNTGLADDLFSFTPPAGVEVVDVVQLMEQKRPRTVSLAEARQAVSFTLLEPQTLPDGVRLVEVQLLNADERGPVVVQIYRGQGLEFSLAQSNGVLERPSGREHADVQTRELTVRGAPARLVEGQGRQPMALLSWQEQGVHIAIAGRLSGEQAISIAESLQ